MSPTDLTIIVPVYNEEESLHKFKEEMDRYLAIAPLPSKVLFVNDGSKDGSFQIIRDITATDLNYSFISLAQNSGLSTAIKAGFDATQTSHVGYIDSDLQTSPSDLATYVPFLKEYEMVNGIRAKRHDSFVKKMSSKIANGFRRLMIDDGIIDTCCPLKILRTDFAQKIPFFKGMYRFIPALVQLHGGRVHQMEVRHFERYAGTAKYHLFNRLVRPFVDTLAFRWMRSRYVRYDIAERSADIKETSAKKATT